jgi:hypothetical protein
MVMARRHATALVQARSQIPATGMLEAPYGALASTQAAAELDAHRLMYQLLSQHPRRRGPTCTAPPTSTYGLDPAA